MKKSKKIISILVSVAMAVSVFIAIGTASYGATVESGSGTMSSPYVVSALTDSELNEIQLAGLGSGTTTWFQLTLAKDCVVWFDNSEIVYYKQDFGAVTYTQDYDGSKALQAGTYKFGLPGAEPETVLGVLLTDPEAPVSPGSDDWIPLTMGTAYNGEFNSSSQAKLTFTISKDAYVTFEYSDPYGYNCPERVVATLSAKESKNNIVGGDNGPSDIMQRNKVTFYLKPDTYYVNISNRAAGPGAQFTFTATKKDFNWGKVTADLKSGSYNITYSPDADTTALDMLYYGSDSISLSGKSASGKLDSTFKPAGYTECKINVYDDYFGYHTIYTGMIAKNPLKPLVFVDKTTKSSVTFRLTGMSKADYGNVILIQKKDGSSWKTVKTVERSNQEKKVTVKGLKSNKTYKFRAVARVNAAKGKPALKSTPKTLTFRTAIAVKPAVKSIKTYGAKTSYVSKKWVSGYWDSAGKFWPGHYVGGYYETNFKIKVTLKKKATGSKGLMINGTYVKGTGKTFTLSGKVQGKSIGKTIKVSVCSYMSTDYAGLSPKYTKKVTIRK